MTMRSRRSLAKIGAAAVAVILEVRAEGVTARLSVAATSPFSAAAVSVGGSHTCALTSTGAAYCWGINANGQLGVGLNDEMPHRTPRRIAPTLSFASLVTGAMHTCGLTRTGEAYCWGGIYAGQAGPAPTQIVGPTGVASALRFVSLTAGSLHTCGLTSDGVVYCWGDNALGQVGDGSDRSAASVLSLTPSPIPRPVVGGHRFVAMAAGAYTTCGIHRWGDVLLGWELQR